MSNDVTHAEEGLEKMEVVGNYHNEFEAAVEEADDKQQVMVMGVDKEIWLDREHENMLDDVVNKASIFYDEFPPLPDFPCMSSSSSSSSLPAPTRPISATSSSGSSAASSSAASWAVLKSDAGEDDQTEQIIHNLHQQCHQDVVDQMMDMPPPPGDQSSTASMEAFLAAEDGTGELDCINVMENIAYLDQLIGSTDIWDPSSIFLRDHQTPQDYQEQQQKMRVEGLEREEQKKEFVEENNNGGLFFLQDSELAVIFFEWLKQNKEYVSAEDMRSIKLKRSTVESASKRLGSTKEGNKQLLKLILEWVEQYQLQKKRMREALAIENHHHHHQFQEPIQNPSPNPNNNLNSSCPLPPPDLNACFSPSPWMAPPPVYLPECSPMVAPSGVFLPGMGSMGDPYSNGAAVPPLNQPANGNHYLPLPEFQAMESAQSWQPSQIPMPSQYVPFPDNGCPSSAAPPPPQSIYGSQYPYQIFDGNGERLMRLGASATKEARKKRMARQRRLATHHYRHQNPINQNHIQAQSNDQHARINVASCTSSPATPCNWVHWPSTSAAPVSAMAVMVPAMDTQPQNYQRPASSARRQGWKTEKNLRFLLQKVLKQSDVGNLGRIVLPKKEAEIHLPELDSRDGIPIAMEDIGTSRVWNMRYRFWPNNKSRMYLLENTGEFVRTNGLQEGDFIVLYSDIKCGKYLIRGVKVRQPGLKSEGKKPARRNLRNIAPAINTSSLSAPINQAVQ